MTFSLMAALGLRQNNSVIDIGCGSLRIARLLIPFLNPGSARDLKVGSPEMRFSNFFSQDSFMFLGSGMDSNLISEDSRRCLFSED